MDSGIGPVLVDLAANGSLEVQQFEATWALTNICSGTCEHVAAVVKFGALESMDALLGAEVGMQLADQAVWCLGNIAGDCTAMRDAVIASGTLPRIVGHAARCGRAPEGTTTNLRNVTWALCNCIRGLPPPALADVQCALPTMLRLAAHSDTEVATDALWGLYYATTPGPLGDAWAPVCLGKPGLQGALQSAKGALDGTTGASMAALRLLGNLASYGGAAQLVTAGLLPHLATVAASGNRRRRRQAMFCLGRMALCDTLHATNPTALAAACTTGPTPVAIPDLLLTAATSGEILTRMQAASALCAMVLRMPAAEQVALGRGRGAQAAVGDVLLWLARMYVSGDREAGMTEHMEAMLAGMLAWHAAGATPPAHTGATTGAVPDTAAAPTKGAPAGQGQGQGEGVPGHDDDETPSETPAAPQLAGKGGKSPPAQGSAAADTGEWMAADALRDVLLKCLAVGHAGISSRVAQFPLELATPATAPAADASGQKGGSS